MAHARFSSPLPGRWSPRIIRHTRTTDGVQFVADAEDAFTKGSCDKRIGKAQEVVKDGRTTEPSTCLHLVIDILLDVLWRSEDSLIDERVNYTVRTPNAMLRVTCYGNESVSDLLARVAQVATDTEREDLNAAALRIQTPGGVHVCVNTKLAVLSPNDELVLGWALSEAAIAKCSSSLSPATGGSPTGSTRSARSSSSVSDELDFPELCNDSAEAAGPSACFVDEPMFGPCVLLNDGLGELPGRGSSEKLVCTLTF